MLFRSPLSALEQQRLAVAVATQRLEMLQTPNVYLELTATTVKDHLRKVLSPVTDISITKLSFINQGLQVDATFHHKLADQRINLYGQVSGNIKVAIEGQSLRFLPVLSSIKIHTIERTGSESPVVTVPTLVAELTAYLENINAQIAKLPGLAIPLPAGVDEVVDLSSQLHNVPSIINVQGGPVKVVAHLSGMLVRIDAAGIKVLGAMTNAPLALATGATLDLPNTATRANVDEAFKEFAKRFDIAAARIVGTRPNNTVRDGALMIRKDAVAAIFNSALSSPNICATFVQELSKVSFDQEIIPFEYPELDCSQTKDCSPTRICEFSRDCSQPVDQRDCRREIRGREYKIRDH